MGQANGTYRTWSRYIGKMVKEGRGEGCQIKRTQLGLFLSPLLGVNSPHLK